MNTKTINRDTCPQSSSQIHQEMSASGESLQRATGDCAEYAERKNIASGKGVEFGANVQAHPHGGPGESVNSEQTSDGPLCRVQRLVRLLGMLDISNPFGDMNSFGCDFRELASNEIGLASTFATLEGKFISERSHGNLAVKTVNGLQSYLSINATEKNIPILNEILGDSNSRQSLFDFCNFLMKYSIGLLQIRDFLGSYSELFFDEGEMLSKDGGATVLFDKSLDKSEGVDNCCPII
jgi:hypothetical protein